jgi:enoyl-CoA hydratase/carnithine racemase
MQRIYHSRRLTVAAVDGFCMGGALIWLCHAGRALPARVRVLRIRRESRYYDRLERNADFAALDCEARALEMFHDGERVSADEALRIN